VAAGGVTQLRYLRYLDERSSTASLGFRVDAGKTVVDGKLDTLPMPPGVTLDGLREEADVATAISIFLQQDADLAAACRLKVETFLAALERSIFFPKHTFLRTTMLFVYDDANRSKVQVKIMNFGASFALPEGERGLAHDAPWDGTATCHEDGYLIGVRSLVRVFTSLSSGS